MDGAPKGFAAGRGLLAAAETLNFNLKEQRPVRQMGGGLSEDQESGSRVGSGNLGGTMKLFASLGLSPSDLDALAQIPEEDISVETLPQILMQLKSHKAGRGPAAPADKSYRGGGGWDDGGRMGGGSSFGQGSGPSDFGLASMQDRGMGPNFSANVGNRERSLAELSQRDSYGGNMGDPQPGFSQRRKGPPSQGKVQDFLGAPPPRFPHVCSLCDFDVHSVMEWTQHTNGLRHAENRRVLLNMYPEWDPSGVPSRSIMESTNMSAGLLGPAPPGLGPSSRMPSSWGPTGSGMGLGMSGQNRQDRSGQNMMRSRVVVVKYDRKPLSNKTLFAFAEPFGRLQEHLVLKNKAFLEMQTREAAVDMVNYYQQNPATLYGKTITFYLSQRLLFIQKDDRADRPERASDRPSWDGKNRGHRSQVVFFSNMPREEYKKKELLTIAARFGVVEKHLFLTDQAFVQLGSCEDAEMMVKYYTVNPLTINGRNIHLNICAKYKTLNINRRQKDVGGGRARRTGDKRKRSRSRSRSQSQSRSRSRSRSRDEENAGKSGSEDGEEVAGVVEGEQEEQEKEEPQDEKTTDGEEKPSQEGEETEGREDDGSSVQKKAPSAENVKDEGPVDEMEAADSAEEDEDFLENMEDFVTLDELPDDEKEAEDQGQSDGIDPSRKGGMRVVNILGFRRGYKYLDELLGLATPFGKVVKHLVLDWRPEAFLQFATEEEARAMAKFYNGNVMASVCGRQVRVTHSMTYPTIKCGANRVVYVGQLPNKYEEQEVLKLAEPYGKVKKYFLNRNRRECFLEMEKPEAAEEMAQAYKTNVPKLHGRRLLIYVSRKYTQLKYGHKCPSAPKKGPTSSSPPKSSKPDEEPPAKKIKEDEQKEVKEESTEEPKLQEDEEQKPQEEEEEKMKEEKEESIEKPHEDEEEKQKKPGEEEEPTERPNEEDEDMPLSPQQKTLPETPEKDPADPEREQNGGQDQMEEDEPAVSEETSTRRDSQSASESKSASASLPLPPFRPDRAIGVEHVKMGYYCRVCLLFYSNENMAKKTHCSSKAHYDKLQKHLEKEQSKAEKKRAKKTSV
ncbi:matrin-3 isoform X3 [Corythoichthys intestinalis]|uniref:matrin-3 isoform X3 n=1 Tax=Corythoichthys intestinalis TaxID=161448 RepID=UPI0025A4D345|nr:matrin 3-like 1.2 isoform X3 [Corythoichthys intestinalis]